MKLTSTRRMFLAGSGGVLLRIPFLSSLASRAALAQNTPTTPLKFVHISSNFCADLAQALPFGPDHRPVSTVTRLDDATKRQALDDIVQRRGFVSNGLKGPQWDSLRPSMNVIMGSALNGANDKHHSCGTTAASMPHDAENNDHPANDNPLFKYSTCFLAEKLLAKPQHAFGALRINLAYRHGTEHGYIASEYVNYAFGGPRADKPTFAVTLPMMRDVAELELKLGQTQVGDPRIQKRQKLIDAVREDYRGVIRNPALSGSDRQRFQHAIDL